MPLACRLCTFAFWVDPLCFNPALASDYASTHFVIQTCWTAQPCTTLIKASSECYLLAGSWISFHEYTVSWSLCSPWGKLNNHCFVPSVMSSIHLCSFAIFMFLLTLVHPIKCYSFINILSINPYPFSTYWCCRGLLLVPCNSHRVGYTLERSASQATTAYTHIRYLYTNGTFSKLPQFVDRTH